MPTKPTLEEDLRAIEALHRHDIDAVLAGDPMALVPQWTEDLVAILPTGSVLRGRAAYAAFAEQTRDQMQGIEILANVVDYEEVKVLGDYAYEWGTYRATMRPRGGGETVAYAGKLLRILQRQSDGTWKMHRGISTNDLPSP
jgi:uncharacterized protein (TIGR02246 family)